MSTDLTEKIDKIIEQEIYPEPLPLPDRGELAVLWCNETNTHIEVKTYDENDVVRWIPYLTQKIAPKQCVHLTARGQYIHVYVGNNQATYECKKGETYIFDGTHARLKS